jgi:hypothetical protein
MPDIRIESFALDPFESRPGSVDFPYDLHGITLQFEAVFSGTFTLAVVIYNPVEEAIFTESVPFLILPFDSPGQAQRMRYEMEIGLRIDRPGRYLVAADCDGKRIAETSFHVRQLPSVRAD